MKAIKVIAAILAAALVFVLVLFVGGLFQRLLITGAQMAQDWGDTVILSENLKVLEVVSDPSEADTEGLVELILPPGRYMPNAPAHSPAA